MQLANLQRERIIGPMETLICRVHEVVATQGECHCLKQF